MYCSAPCELRWVDDDESCGEDEEIPPEYICVITQEVMHEPVMLFTSAGASYEKWALSKWLERYPRRDPLTGREHTSELNFVPNRSLEASIVRWRRERRRARRLVTKTDELREMLAAALLKPSMRTTKRRRKPPCTEAMLEQEI